MKILLAYLQLCRFAALFTALADIVLGIALSHQPLDWRSEFCWLLMASAGLYLSGMVWNDLFDRHVDALERPKRPIPSGRVSVESAALFGGGLMLAGVACALAAGWQTTLVAMALVACILLYDGVLKATAPGPVMMGACRFLNVMLGASLAPDPGQAQPTLASVWNVPQLYAAAALGTYIAGVTWFSRRETGQSSAAALLGAAAVVNLGLAGLAAFLLTWPDPFAHRPRALAALVLVGLVINRALARAVRQPAPGFVQQGVRTMLLWLILLDATLVFYVQPENRWALIVAALMIPAQLLGRALAIT